MLGIFLLPISPSFEIKKNGQLTLETQINKVNAAGETTLSITPKDTSANISIKISQLGFDDSRYNLAIILFDSDVLPDINNLPEEGVQTVSNYTKIGVKNSDVIDHEFTGLKAGHKYIIQVVIAESASTSWITYAAMPFSSAFLLLKTAYDFFFGNDPSVSYRGSKVFTTNSAPDKTDGTFEETKVTTPPYDLACSINPAGTQPEGLFGCIAAFLYSVVWGISAQIAHLAGIFLDFLIYYSTNSSSYVSTFVTKGWGAVRDVANIFFIIALLYIAIKMILSLGDSHSKKLISTIIIVALIINFSLFVTRVVIDGSNILAKVFYNNIDSKYDNKEPAIGAKGEKSISIGLINKFNPQEIITNQQDYIKNQGTFMFITLLAIAITLFTAYIFFSVGLLFVSRVVMLWFSMIFAPIAFASYTLPFDIPGLGHKEWWKNLFENAFLAPIFIFMLYLVVMFAGFLNEIIQYPVGAEPIQKIMGIVIPFVLLMVLLMKAKDMAVKYAGEMGAAVVKGAAVMGGLALGGAALGAATLGRNAIGKVMQRATRSDASRKYENYANAQKDFKAGKITSAQLKTAKDDVDKLSLRNKVFGKMGYGLNKSQSVVEKSHHARHELDKESAARYDGKTFKELSGTEQAIIKDRITKNEIGHDIGGKNYKDLTAADQKLVRDKIDDMKLNKEELKGDEYFRESKHKTGTRTTMVQAMRTGSWDVRELSKVTASEYDKVNTKFLSGLTSVLGNTMRGSIKSTFGSEYGASQKHFFKDLGHTVSEAMKGAKINIDLSHVGEEKKEGHGGGHGGGGHH